MTTSLEVRTRDEDGVAVAWVEGEIDMANADELTSSLTAAVSNSSLGLIVDLSATRYLDSAGMRALLQLRQRLRTRRQELRLVVPSAGLIRHVLEVARLDAVIAIDDSVEDALLRLSR